MTSIWLYRTTPRLLSVWKNSSCPTPIIISITKSLPRSDTKHSSVNLRYMYISLVIFRSTSVSQIPWKCLSQKFQSPLLNDNYLQFFLVFEYVKGFPRLLQIDLIVYFVFLDSVLVIIQFLTLQIKYTMGDPDNMAIARTYFAQAIKLNPNSVRSLYGCFLVSTCIQHCVSIHDSNE